MNETVVRCERCGLSLRLAPKPQSKAKMLRRSTRAKGLCATCAAHNWLRNTYPCNMLLAESGPKGLELPHIQRQFANIMQAAGADAQPDEIDWNSMIENWQLPFSHPVKPTAVNPCSQADLERMARDGRGWDMIPEE